MLAAMMQEPIERLTIGARTHAMLAWHCGEAFARRLEADDWTCHRCGFRLPDFMEIDHPDRHDTDVTDGLRTICQFCHNLRHPIWAALRGRLRLIWAPAMPQSELNRMAWLVMMSSEDHRGQVADDELQEASAAIIEAVGRRESMMSSIVGSANPGGLIDAIFTVRSLAERERYLRALHRVDEVARFWPIAACRSTTDLERPSMSLSRWDGNCFVDMAGLAIAEFWKRERSVDQLRAICRRHLAGIDV